LGLCTAGRTKDLANAQAELTRQASEVQSLHINAAQLSEAKRDVTQQLEQHQKDLVQQAEQHAQLQTAHAQTTAHCGELETQVEAHKERLTGT
jgi:chromosome segregation ATPase